MIGNNERYHNETIGDTSLPFAENSVNELKLFSNIRFNVVLKTHYFEIDFSGDFLSRIIIGKSVSQSHGKRRFLRLVNSCQKSVYKKKQKKKPTKSKQKQPTVCTVDSRAY